MACPIASGGDAGDCRGTHAAHWSSGRFTVVVLAGAFSRLAAARHVAEHDADTLAAMNDFELTFDTELPLRAGGLGHNRWHPDIPPVARVQPDQVISFWTRDGSDGQISPATRADEFTTIDADVIHTLTGPFFIETAEPGDQLRVEVLGIEPANHGVTLMWPGSGFGLLPDDFDESLIVHWQIEDGVARSKEMRGIAIAGRPFLGIMGVAPSHARMAEITARETLLVSSGFAVLAPDPSSAFPSGGATADSGLRTAPPRETGGNIDIKQLTAGSVVTLPVDVPGALFSAGDCHFAQGDGEVTGTAIEITGKVRLRFSVVKPAEQLWQPRFPTFEYREEPTRIARRYIGTTGIPVNSDGQNGYLDLTMAAEEAVREMIACLVGTRGLTRAQAYVLVSVAGDLRISECVDVPNAIVSVHLPLDVFEGEPQEA